MNARAWWAGARPRTLPLALGPVIVGSASAYWVEAFSPVRASLALVVAIALQVGVNFANDYSDGIRGTDAHRVGPPRLTGSGAVSPKKVLGAAIVSFGVAGASGLWLIVLSGAWWLLILGAVAFVAAWFYTGGKRPYGYAGLGEIVVFVFFGPVATVGTAYVHAGFVPWDSWFSGVALGFFAAAVLLVNNLRDIDQDALAGKITLAVKVGPTSAKALISTFLAIPYLVAGFLSMLFVAAPLTLLTLFIAIPTMVIVWRASSAKELVTALQLMTLNSLAYAIFLGMAIAF